MNAVITNEVFLEALFADAAPGAYTIITSFPGDPYKAGRFEWAGRPWRPGQRLRRGFDCGNPYLTVSAFEADPETGEQRRRKAQFHSLHAVMIDDVGTKVPPDRVLLAPSAEIETSPQNFQDYLFVVQDTAARDRVVCERLINAMIAYGLTTAGKDPGMAGVTRYGRLPNGVNGKAKYVAQLGRPFRTHCTSFDPARRYTLAQIAAAWQLDITTPVRPRTVVTFAPAQVARAGEQFTALLETLAMLGLYKGRIGPGPWHEITCPWVYEHTDHADSGAAVCEPAETNGFRGGFRCHHGHGAALHITNVHEFLRALVREVERARRATEVMA